jgi:hypothetical protein
MHRAPPRFIRYKYNRCRSSHQAAHAALTTAVLTLLRLSRACSCNACRSDACHRCELPPAPHRSRSAYLALEAVRVSRTCSAVSTQASSSSDSDVRSCIASPIGRPAGIRHHVLRGWMRAQQPYLSDNPTYWKSMQGHALVAGMQPSMSERSQEHYQAWHRRSGLMPTCESQF